MGLERIDQIEQELSNITKINDGGQKEVFSAMHPKYGKVAYKKVENLDREEKNRIEREANILKDLDHEAFPKLYEIIFSEDGTRCIILEEFIEGETLDKVMPNYYDPKEALLLIRQITEILSIIWDKRIVHRDIKPTNIMIGKDGKVTIIDFGIARALDDKTITGFGGAPRTLLYAAPEQIKYEKAKITIRTDQFALGIILGQMLFKGIHPYDEKLTRESNRVKAILNDNWYRNGIQGRPKLSALMERLLSTHSHSRYPNAKRLIQAIDEAIGEWK
ncbi:MAG: serine/threonine-protein kinase [Chloroflexota bacterium]|nr:serine/threonine-protein kinase [Chloroflexota bacterium]